MRKMLQNFRLGFGPNKTKNGKQTTLRNNKRTSEEKKQETRLCLPLPFCFAMSEASVSLLRVQSLLLAMWKVFVVSGVPTIDPLFVCVCVRLCVVFVVVFVCVCVLDAIFFCF